MRRKRISSGSCSILRSGVIARVKMRKRSVQSPVSCCRNSTGLAPSCPRSVRATSTRNGTRQNPNTATLVHLLDRMARTLQARSVIFLQIHPIVKAGDLIAVAVEHERVAPENFAEAALRSLAPAWMVHGWIHVRVKAVLLGGVAVPGSGRLLLLEADSHDGFDALVAVFPGHHDAHRSPVLIRQGLAIHSDAQHGQRMHSFVEAQTFDVGEIDSTILGFRHLCRIEKGLERHVLRFRCRLDELGQRAERETDPRHHDGPALDAAVAVDTLFERRELEDFVHGKLAWLGHFALYGNTPRRSAEVL